MKASQFAAAAVMAVGLATSLSSFAQTSNNGTATGTDTSTRAAGTGNAGDKTTQAGTSTGAMRATHKTRKAKRAASAASRG